MSKVKAKEKNRFFEFDNYIQKDRSAHLIYAERNIGKSSYFLWKGGKVKSILERYNNFHPDNIIWDKHSKTGQLMPVGIREGKNGRFAYVRTSKNQTEMSIKMIQSLLPGCKISTSDKIIFKPFYKHDDTKNENPEWIECGVILDLSTSFKTAKSYTFAGYDFMFWDECNEVQTRVKQIYFKFINLLKTVQRFMTTFELVIVGNKDTTNDELMTAFGIRAPIDTSKTYIFSRPEYDLASYIIGTSDFTLLNQNTLLANKLANADDSTMGYLNDGAFGFDYSRKILTFKDYVKPTFTPLFKFIFGVSIFYFGRFLNQEENNKQCFYIVRESKYTFYDNQPYLSFDILGGSFESSSLMLDKDTLNGFGKMFFFAFKQGILFLNDFDTFEELIPLFTKIDINK